jgi:phosphoglycerate kinase
MPIKKMKDLVLKNKRVLIREDLNVPMENGEITSDVRIRAALPTIKYAIKEKARVIIMSHLGRPDEGKPDSALSLAPVAARLSKLLKQEVVLVKDWLKGVEVKPGQVVLCENVRFNKGEKANDTKLSKKMAELCDIYVMDAFATAHRAEASTCGVIKYAPIACAGPLLAKELKALDKVLKKPKAPVVAIIGGSKVSSKVKVLSALIDKVDTLIVGGGIANTFIAAEGHSVGTSLYEPDFVATAKQLIASAKSNGKKIPIPEDVVVAAEFSASAKAQVKLVSEVTAKDKILDIGPKARRQIAAILKKAGTILWNGPVGAFEIEQFSKGTEAVGKAVANSEAFSVAGGGDTIAAIEKYGLSKEISYISTGGGAFLEYVEGTALPAIVALEAHAKESK